MDYTVNINDNKQTMWISVSEYARQIGKSRQWVYQMIREGRIPKDKVRAVKVQELLEVFYEKK